MKLIFGAPFVIKPHCTIEVSGWLVEEAIEDGAQNEVFHAAVLID